MSFDPHLPSLVTLRLLRCHVSLCLVCLFANEATTATHSALEKKSSWPRPLIRDPAVREYRTWRHMYVFWTATLVVIVPNFNFIPLLFFFSYYCCRYCFQSSRSFLSDIRKLRSPCIEFNREIVGESIFLSEGSLQEKLLNLRKY